MTPNLHFFDAIFIINLVDRGDRRQEMQEQLVRIGLDINTPPIQLYTAVRPSEPGGFPSIGARGCFESHLSILEIAIKNQMERILILEDDVDFVADFSNRIPRILAQLDTKPWNFFYGGYRLSNAIENNSTELLKVSSDFSIGCAHFIAFDKVAIETAAIFLREVITREPGSPLGGPMHVDGAYSWVRKLHLNLNTFLAYPELAVQRSSRSDITPTHWFDKIRAFRPAVNFLRRQFK